MRRRLALAAVFAAAAVAARAQPAREKPAALRDVGYDQRLGEQVPLDLAFRDEAGRSVTLRSLFRGRAVVLSLAYYECPMLCTLTLNGLMNVHCRWEALGENPGMALVPPIDYNRENNFGGLALGGAEWATGWGMSMSWHLLTTAKDQKTQ